MLKTWYACSVPESCTLSDVYNEYSAGILDQGTPLPEKYNTAFVAASIGHTPMSLTNCSCTLRVGEALSSLGIYIEFIVSKDGTAMVNTSESKSEVMMNAFAVLMKSSRERVHLPPKYEVKQPNAKLQLKSNIIDWLAKSKFGWERPYAETA